MSKQMLRDLAGACDLAAAHFESHGREQAQAGDTAAAHDCAVVAGVMSGLSFALHEAAKREPLKEPR